MSVAGSETFSVQDVTEVSRQPGSSASDSQVLVAGVSLVSLPTVFQRMLGERESHQYLFLQASQDLSGGLVLLPLGQKLQLYG